MIENSFPASPDPGAGKVGANPRDLVLLPATGATAFWQPGICCWMQNMNWHVLEIHSSHQKTYFASEENSLCKVRF
ncbi:hypothetical protein [uncultured Robinsoniella sp.]|uniref:hypothetical protein n=1 Tax=uncultured Robinsoniella sp. TaxID=904190 RepID=UPI00374E3DDF